MKSTLKGLPDALHDVAYETGLEVPGADGRVFQADHYFPAGDGDHPTLLVRTPYGLGFPWATLFGLLYSEQGFHVVLAGCLGPAEGADGWRKEGADGHAAVCWLREQPWFNGVLGTLGPSYMSYVQWALAADPPPELRAMVMQMGLSEPHALAYTGGAFNLENMLVASMGAVHQKRGLLAYLGGVLRLQRRLKKVARADSLADAYVSAIGERVPFFEETLGHSDITDSYWSGTDMGPVADRLTVPTALITGWSDLCLDQTLRQYERLTDAGTPTSLLVGPWTHTSAFDKGLKEVFTESLSWLRAHLCDDKSGLRPTEVRVWTGHDDWRDLPSWPPAKDGTPWFVHEDGTLGTEQPHAPMTFRYDPARPPPSVGGPVLTVKSGPQDNRALEARDDVLVFTGRPLAEPLDVLGKVTAAVTVSVDTGQADLFARLCLVDPKGHSTNLCDGLVRLDLPAGTTQEITVPMSSTACRIPAGHRIRLQLSGGACPRFDRHRHGPSRISVHHPTALFL